MLFCLEFWVVVGFGFWRLRAVVIIGSLDAESVGCSRWEFIGGGGWEEFSPELAWVEVTGTEDVSFIARSTEFWEAITSFLFWFQISAKFAVDCLFKSRYLLKNSSVSKSIP